MGGSNHTRISFALYIGQCTDRALTCSSSCLPCLRTTERRASVNTGRPSNMLSTAEARAVNHDLCLALNCRAASAEAPGKGNHDGTDVKTSRVKQALAHLVSRAHALGRLEHLADSLGRHHQLAQDVADLSEQSVMSWAMLETGWFDKRGTGYVGALASWGWSGWG